jgi:hypothetical protein
MVFGLEALFDVHGALLARQSPDMAKRSQDLVVRSEELLDGFRLGWRFDDYEVMRHISKVSLGMIDFYVIE